jgi:hypothetical protein
MTLKQLEAVYVRACRKRRLRPNQAEGQEWFLRLSGFDIADVEAALAAWDADPALDLNGKPKAKWLPSAVELVALTAAIAGKKVRKTAGRLRELRWRCDGVFQHEWMTFIPEEEQQAEAINCPWCGAPAQVEG